MISFWVPKAKHLSVKPFWAKPQPTGQLRPARLKEVRDFGEQWHESKAVVTEGASMQCCMPMSALVESFLNQMEIIMVSTKGSVELSQLQGCLPGSIFPQLIFRKLAPTRNLLFCFKVLLRPCICPGFPGMLNDLRVPRETLPHSVRGTTLPQTFRKLPHLHKNIIKYLLEQ